MLQPFSTLLELYRCNVIKCSGGCRTDNYYDVMTCIPFLRSIVITNNILCHFYIYSWPFLSASLSISWYTLSNDAPNLKILHPFTIHIYCILNLITKKDFGIARIEKLLVVETSRRSGGGRWQIGGDA